MTYTSAEQAAYNAGVMSEWARQRENVADLISGLLAQFADVETGFMRLARYSREEHIKTELAQMISDCHKISGELKHPRGYRWRGTSRGDTTDRFITADGEWRDVVLPNTPARTNPTEQRQADLVSLLPSADGVTE